MEACAWGGETGRRSDYVTTLFQGLWRNAEQAELSLAVTQGGEVVGIYRRAVDGEIREYGLCGHAIGDRLVFSVRFADQGSIGSWSGWLREDGEGLCMEALTWTVSPSDRDASSLRRTLQHGIANDSYQRIRRLDTEVAASFLGPAFPARAKVTDRPLEPIRS